MKNLLNLVIALLLGVSLTFAQNLSEVEQHGDAHTAAVEQTGSNYSSVDQSSFGHSAVVNQTGTDNESYVDQTSLKYSKSKGSDATVMQDGEENLAVVNQLDLGVENKAVIEQTGASNDAKVDQASGKFFGSNYNEAKTTQDGDNNFARQYQSANYQRASIEQLGDENVAIQKQLSGMGSYDAKNWASISQKQSYAYAEQNQTGEGNYAEIKQNAYVDPKFGDVNFQFQTGKDNKALAHTYGGKNYGTQTQLGDRNWTYVKEAGSYNSFVVKQVGEKNQAFEQTTDNCCSQYNELTTVQFGDNNKSYMSVEGRYNDATVCQDGDNNTVGTAQDDLGVVQEGDCNFTLIEQKGDSNAASSFQYGDENASDIMQHGDHNSATVTQSN